MNRQFLAVIVEMGFLYFGCAAPLQAQHEHHEMQHCAKACSDCQRTCDSCSAHCARLLKEGKTEHYATLRSCEDCADVCSAASRIVSRGGPAVSAICQACADACAICGANCEKQSDDAHMKECAQECKKCEKACLEMLKTMKKQ